MMNNTRFSSLRLVNALIIMILFDNIFKEFIKILNKKKAFKAVKKS